MQSRINQHVQKYWNTFKEDLKKFSLEKASSKEDILTFVENYDVLVFEKEDLEKKKVVLPSNCRCIAKKSDEEQCTRRNKKNSEFCGTHEEKRPYGVIEEAERPTTQQIHVWVQEIKGILYHIDNGGNVYKQEDVMQKKMNPKIIAKYVLSEDGTYSIPEFGI